MSAFSDEYGWLLELPGPVYLGAQDDGILGWTTDSLKAIRFARRDDAALYAKLEGLTEASPVEHAWCQPRAAAAEEVQDSAREPDFLDRKIVSAAHRYLSVVALLFDSRNTPCLAERNPLTDRQCHEAFLELDTAGKALRAAMQERELAAAAKEE